MILRILCWILTSLLFLSVRSWAASDPPETPLPKAFFSFSTDDNYRDFNLGLKNVFDKYGLKYTLGIIYQVSLDATKSNAGISLTYGDLRSFIDGGYEIASHSYTHAQPLLPRQAVLVALNDEASDRDTPTFSFSVLSDDESLSLVVDKKTFPFRHTTMGSFVRKANRALSDASLPLTLRP